MTEYSDNLTEADVEAVLRATIERLIEDAMIDAEVDYPAGSDAGHRISWDSDSLLNGIMALIPAPAPAEQEPVAVIGKDYRLLWSDAGSDVGRSPRRPPGSEGGMTPDQYRREGAEAMREVAAEVCADYPLIAPDETEWTLYDEQIAHSQACIRAIDVDEVLAGMPPTNDAVALLVEAARAALNYLENTEGEFGITLESATDIRTALAAMETSHD